MRALIFALLVSCAAPKATTMIYSERNQIPPAAVGQVITIRGVLQRSKIPSVLGIDVGDADLLSDKVVTVRGRLVRHEERERGPEEPIVATRGAGVYYSLVDPVTGRLATPTAD